MFGDTIMGYGSYRSVGRSGRKIRMGNAAPRIRNSNGRFIVSHTEYLGDLVSNSAFVNTAFTLNPGLELAEGGFCAWLPRIAANFEQYKARGIIFTFKSTSSDAVLAAAANSALGTISMATDYNVLNPPFGNKQQMENYEYSNSCKPSIGMSHCVECARSQTSITELYVRTSSVPAGADARLYDLGTFQIATSGQQVSGGILGELWVSYEFEFLKPRIPVGGVDPDVSFDHIAIFNANVATVGVLPATPFGTSTTVPIYPSTESTLGGVCCGGAVTAVSFAPQKSPTETNFVGGINVLDANGLPTGAKGAAAGNQYFFPPGQSAGVFMVQYNAVWGVTGIPAAMVPTLTNCTAKLLLDANTLGIINNLSSANSTTTNTTFFVTITRANASFSMIGSAGATTPTWADLYVVELPAVIN